MNTMSMTIAIVGLLLAACGGNGSSESAGEAGAQVEAAERAGEDPAEETAAEEGHVELSDAQIASAGLELGEAEPTSIRDVLSVYGVVAPNAERVFNVSARFPGLIRGVSRKIGDNVRQGDVLATIESNESLRTYEVTAPIAGVITARDANAGEQSGDRSLFTIADLSTVWVEVSLFPRDTAKVRVGQVAHVLSSDRGLAGTGRVVYLAPFGTSSNQTLTARVLLDNADRTWAPGLYVTAELTLSEQQASVAVRNEALQTVEGRTVVFVRNEHGFEAKSVALGKSDSLNTEITEGLTPGETYVGRNSFILKAELGKGEAEHGH